MLHRAHHVLFNRADRDAELPGDIAAAQTLEPAQHEDGSRPLWKGEQSRDRRAHVLPAAENALCIELEFPVQIWIEGDMRLSPSRRPAPCMVREHACCRLV